MKLQLTLIIVSFLHLAVIGQNSILYDLDSYKRVIGQYRTTFIIPDANLGYTKALNSPGQSKEYQISVGGEYIDNKILNDEKNQKTFDKEINFGIQSGSNKLLSFNFKYRSENRIYNDDSKYFKRGLDIISNNRYQDAEFQFKTYGLNNEVKYDLGFGFGRLEIINNAWFGGRVLEELQSKRLLTKIPSVEEMKMFFDLIGDLEFERVMDDRFRSIYRIEKMMEYVEQNGWIAKGSIPAFVTMYDAFLFENFIFRQSGKRLEFTLSPTVQTSILWIPDFSGIGNSFSKKILAGFNGNIEYEMHENGDLAYYTTKLIGGRIQYLEDYSDDLFFVNSNIVAGELYFTYRYRYIPSLRTNLQVASNVSAGFVYAQIYSARFSANTRVDYNYFFSAATRLVLSGQLIYNDQNFQIGDFQPVITANFSVNVVHALR